jgi:hypothetical protein
MSEVSLISDEKYQQALKELDKQIDKYCQEDGGCTPEFFRLTIHFRCIQIINAAVKKKECRTEIRFKDIIKPYAWYDSNMIHEIYTDVELFFLRRGIEIHFYAFNPGSVVYIKYLVLTSAPDSFLRVVRERLREEITYFIESYTHWSGNLFSEVFHSHEITLKDIMGPYLPYEKEVYSCILGRILSLFKEKITYTIDEKSIDLYSPYIRKQS